MLDFLRAPFADGPAVSPRQVLVRLISALIFGFIVAEIYRRTRRSSQISASLPVTLVLLSVLISMVTQVIGDNVARAFSLVGALSIVRFRTVVRDTQDTAYVIFAVVVGMAVGAKDLWVAVIGVLVIGAGAWLMLHGKMSGAAHAPVLLNLRVGLGHDLNPLLSETLDRFLHARDLMHVGIAGKGVAMEVTYEARLKSSASPEGLVRALNQLDGVQRVELQRRGFDPD